VESKNEEPSRRCTIGISKCLSKEGAVHHPASHVLLNARTTFRISRHGGPIDSRRDEHENRSDGGADLLGFRNHLVVRLNGQQESVAGVFHPAIDCTDGGGLNRILELGLPGDLAGLLNVEAKLMNQVFRNRTFGGEGVLFARVFVKIDE